MLGGARVLVRQSSPPSLPPSGFASKRTMHLLRWLVVVARTQVLLRIREGKDVDGTSAQGVRT